MLETSYYKENHERITPDVEEENINQGILVSSPKSLPPVSSFLLPPSPTIPCLPSTTPCRPMRPPGPPGFTPKAEEILTKYRQVLVNDETMEGSELMENVTTHKTLPEDEATNETLPENESIKKPVAKNESTNETLPYDEATIDIALKTYPEEKMCEDETFKNNETNIEDGEIHIDEKTENSETEEEPETDVKETNADEKMHDSEEDQLEVAKLRLVHWTEKDMEKISDINRNVIKALDIAADISKEEISGEKKTRFESKDASINTLPEKISAGTILLSC